MRFREAGWWRKSWLVVAAIALVATACGGGEAPESEGAATSEAGFTTLKPGVLTVGSNIVYQPFEFIDPSTDMPVGFDIDLCTEIAHRLGLDVEFVDNPSFDSLIPSLQNGAYDIVCAATVITPERAGEVNFSDPYFDVQDALVVSVEHAPPGLNGLEDLTEDMIIGLEKNTTLAEFAHENLEGKVKEIREYDNTQFVRLDLVSGRIDAELDNLPAAAYAIATEFKDTLKIVEVFQSIPGAAYGIYANKDNPDLIEAVNQQLAEIRADGTYDEIFAKWFGEIEL